MFLIPLLVSLAGAQGVDETPVFKSGVSNVRIDVQVTHDGRPVTDLKQSDFAVFDNGKQQNIVYFAHESEPLSLLLLLDVSGSTREHIEQIAQAARQSLRFLQPKDRVAIMLFARDTRVHLEWTDDVGEIESALKQAKYDEKLGAGTNINESLVAGAKYIEESAGAAGRRAILILSDNMGLNYKSPDQAVIDTMQDADAVVNGIIVGKGERPERAVNGGIYRNPDFTDPDIYFISEQTGGEALTQSRHD